jgi:hypothetical protein
VQEALGLNHLVSIRQQVQVLQGSYIVISGNRETPESNASLVSVWKCEELDYVL